MFRYFFMSEARVQTRPVSGPKKREFADKNAITMTMTTSINRIELSILTGFLGSGKTTLLNTILRDPEVSDTAVIVNEFGEIGLDHLLIKGGVGDVILLDSGCLCCAAGESFADTLIDLWAQRQRGNLPPFRRVVVETSGLAMPLPLIATVMKNPVIAPRYCFARVITTVDTAFGIETLSAHRVAVEQLALADVVVLTKVDHPDSRVADTLQAVEYINANMSVMSLPADKVDYSRLLQAPFHSATIPAESTATHGDHATQKSWRSTQAVDWAGIAAFAAALRSDQDRPLRCKGIFSVARESRPVMIQSVRSVVETSRLERWPDQDHDSRFVCIYENPPHAFDALVSALDTERGMLPAHQPGH